MLDQGEPVLPDRFILVHDEHFVEEGVDRAARVLTTAMASL